MSIKDVDFKKLKKMIEEKDFTPMKAIRKYCLECVGYHEKEVRNCTMPGCPLYPYRMGSYPKEKDNSPLKAIRKHCLECFSGSYKWVERCDTEHCFLFPYRFGKNPCKQDE